MTTITVPDYITDVDDAAAYIRKELIARGIDPDSVYPIGPDDGQEVLTAPRASPFMVEMSFSYDNNWRERWNAESETVRKHIEKALTAKKKPVDMNYQSGFGSFGG